MNPKQTRQKVLLLSAIIIYYMHKTSYLLRPPTMKIISKPIYFLTAHSLQLSRGLKLLAAQCEYTYISDLANRYIILTLKSEDTITKEFIR